jgi:sec-independent protein translocase protein TatA
MTSLYELTHLMGNLFQPWHIILLLGIIILFFGGSKIPELMRGVGKGMGEFKKGVEEGKTSSDDDDDDKKKSA